MSIKLTGNNESTFAQNIKTAKQVEVSDGIKFGDGTVQTTAATGGGGGGDVIYNGASAWGSVAATTVDGPCVVDASQNIQSVTRNGKGFYDVVFVTPMPNASYSVQATANDARSLNTGIYNRTTTGFRVSTYSITTESVGDIGFGFAVFASNAIAPQAGVGADAWGNIQADGTLNAGFNVSSVTRNGPGDYSIRLSEKIPTAYAVTVGGDALSIKVPSTADNQINIQTFNSAGTQSDYKFTFAAFGSSTVTPTYTWTRQGTTLLPANAGDDVVVGGNKLYESFGIDVDYGTVTNTYGLRLKGDDNSNKIRLNTDGSVVAAGNVETRAVLVDMLDGDESATSTLSNFKHKGNTKLELKTNGNAEFAGSITATGEIQTTNIITSRDVSDPTNKWCYLTNTGLVFNSSEVRITNSSSVGVGFNSGQTAWAAVSQRSLKTDFEPITSGLEKVATLSSVTGRYKSDEVGVRRSFLFADEVKEVLPESVSGDGTEDNPLELRYTEVIPLLVAALKEAKQEIDNLKAEVAALKS